MPTSDATAQRITASIQRCKPSLVGLLMMLSDMAAFFLGAFVAVAVRYYLEGQFEPVTYWRLWPMLMLCVLTYAALGLYPGLLMTAPDELKKSFWGTSLVLLGFGAGAFMTRDSELYSRAALLGAFVLIITLVPVLRMLARRAFSHRAWWGRPVVIFGPREQARAVVRHLEARPRIGLRPVAIVSRQEPPEDIDGLPALSEDEATQALRGKTSLAYAIITTDGLHKDRLHTMAEDLSQHYKRIILIPDSLTHSTLWATALDIGGIVGLMTHQKLLDPWRQHTKRAMDLLLTLLAAPLLIPLTAAFALAIVLDTPGPVFHRQQRIGSGGKAIRIWKFRTMVKNADTILDEYLERNPELRQEWEANHKLRNDPRITRVGRFLRTTSLDELPQLWNVLRGELSLVGPRPIVDAEICKYDRCFELYRRVKPGLTGLWQISGRNDLTYDQRVDLDAYYIRNWSVWFDIYIILRTPLVVLQGLGAY